MVCVSRAQKKRRIGSAVSPETVIAALESEALLVYLLYTLLRP